jgi:hypothetical protein
MKRVASVLAGLVLLIAASVVPVAADTSAGGSRLQSSSSSCVDGLCTDTNISAFLDLSGGTACIEFLAYTDETFVSDESGCAPTRSFTISKTLAASFGATSIPLEICDETSCTATRTVTVSASDTPTGPITTTRGRSTTKNGTCISKIKFTDRSVNVAGSYTIDGVTTAETGFVSVHTETSKTTCRSSKPAHVRGLPRSR